MKKLIEFSLALLLIAFLSACGEESQDSSVSEPADSAAVTQPATETSGIFDSIKDALNKSIPLKCSYTSPEGDKSTVYFKKDVVRIDTEKQASGDPGFYGLVKENKMYIWGEDSDTGMVFDFSKIKPEDNSMKIGEKPIHSTDDIVNEIETQKQNCSKAVVSDSIFDVPADIKFLGL